MIAITAVTILIILLLLIIVIIIIITIINNINHNGNVSLQSSHLIEEMLFKVKLSVFFNVSLMSLGLDSKTKDQ